MHQAEEEDKDEIADPKKVCVEFVSFGYSRSLGRSALIIFVIPGGLQIQKGLVLMSDRCILRPFLGEQGTLS